MKRGVQIGFAAFLLLMPPLAAKSVAQPVAPSTFCRVRISMLQSYGPLQAIIPDAEKLNAEGVGGTARRDTLRVIDRDFAKALVQFPANDEAAFALTDVERMVEGLERCADASGVARSEISSAGPALEAAYRRNGATMLRPDFAERLLRSPRAVAVLKQDKRTDVLASAESVRDANVEARRQVQIARAKATAERDAIARAEVAEAERVAQAKVQALEDVWRHNPSAPSSNACSNTLAASHFGRSRDAAWLALLEKEIGQCQRVSDRRDTVFYMGLALGTAVSDEQLVHASGRALACFSDSAAKRLFDGTNRGLDQIYAMGGYGSTGLRLVPEWTERQTGNRRIVQIRCDVTMSLFGIDLTPMQRRMANAMDADSSSYLEYELVGGRLLAIRTHLVLSNEVKRESGSFGTTMTCNERDGQADSVADGFRASGWRQLARLPWRYTMKNDRLTAVFAGPESVQDGNWYTFQRGSVVIDIYNTRYRPPVLGENGTCNGGSVDEFAMLAPARVGRVKPGTSVAW